MRTTITQVGPGSLAYRGHDVRDLVGDGAPFERVRALLVDAPEESPSPQAPAGAAPASTRGVLERPGSGVPSSAQRRVLTGVLGALPAGTGPLDRFKHAVLVAGSTDAGRHDRSPSAFVRAGRRAAWSMALSLPGAEPRPAETPTLAATLATALKPCPTELLDAALVLLADHDLAVSTTAVRVAVSSGADPYSSLLAGLAAADSPLHMTASLQTVDWLVSALRSPQEALDAALAAGRPPGFGHLVYTEQDPRAQVLLELLRPECPAQDWEALRLLERELLERRGWVANVDLALALLVRTYGLPRHAGAVVFACARTAGWTAHALEELQEPAMRFRLRGVYSGPR